MRTEQEFLDYWEDKLLSILFRAYHDRDRDAAMLYRRQVQDHERLRSILRLLYLQEVAQPQAVASIAVPAKVNGSVQGQVSQAKPSTTAVAAVVQRAKA